MSDKQLIIGSRGSKLALLQANIVKNLLNNHHPEFLIDIKIIKTKGDIIQDVPLATIGGKGLFTKEIEDSLLQGEIDLAVHSMKDLPTTLPVQLCLGAILDREDPRDAFISYKHQKFFDLPKGAIVATSSMRRRANILKQRPDIQIVDMRGNVDTRLRKLKENSYDGMILAAAGLLRMGYKNEIKEIIEIEQMMPAVAQGALGVEVRENDQSIISLLKPLHDINTSITVCAERAFLRELEGGCQVPIGALAQFENGKFSLQGFISSLDGTQYYSGSISGRAQDAEQIGVQLAHDLCKQGAQKVLDEIYGKESSE